MARLLQRHVRACSLLAVLLAVVTFLLVGPTVTTAAIPSQEVRGGSTKVVGTSTGTGTGTRSSLWWQSLFDRPKQYRRALEEQIQWLEQELRQVMDEKMRIQQQLQTQQQQAASEPSGSSFLLGLRRSASTSTSLAQRQTLQLQQQQVDLLQAQLDDLVEGKEALQELLSEQQRHIDHLVEECEQAHWNRCDVRAQYQEQVEHLTHQLHQQTQDRLAAMEERLQERIVQAQQNAREQVWHEGKERLSTLSAEFTQRYQDELQTQRLQTQQAVEKQKRKMRSLAKAMAQREQKLYHQQQQELLADQERRRKVQETLQQQQQERVAKLEAERMERLEQEKRQEDECQKENTATAAATAAAAEEEGARHKSIFSAKRQTKKRAEASVSSSSPITSSLQKVLGPIRGKSKSKQGRKTGSPLSTTSNAAYWQRRVPWQPGLPPTDLIL